MFYPPHIIGWWCLDYLSQTSCHHLALFFLLQEWLVVPKEMNYFVPGAQGNTATCTAQGFHLSSATVGVGVAAVYICRICLYYFSIVRYNKKDEYYIWNKLEPWFHGISLLYLFVFDIIAITMNEYIARYGAVSALPTYVASDTIVEKRPRASVYHADVVMSWGGEQSNTCSCWFHCSDFNF